MTAGAAGFAWGDLRIVAGTLRTVGHPAADRTAINRLYLVAFHAARDWLVREGHVRATASHGLVWGRFDEIAASPGPHRTTFRLIGIRGRDLLALRKGADYDAAPLADHDVQRAFDLSDDVVALIRAVNG